MDIIDEVNNISINALQVSSEQQNIGSEMTTLSLLLIGHSQK